MPMSDSEDTGTQATMPYSLENSYWHFTFIAVNPSRSHNRISAQVSRTAFSRLASSTSSLIFARCLSQKIVDSMSTLLMASAS